MNPNLDDRELDLLLPMRAGLPLGDLLTATFLEGAEVVLLPGLETLGFQKGQSARVFSDDPDDSGTRCHLDRWAQEEIVFEPDVSSPKDSWIYQNTLIFLLARPWMLGFFAGCKSSSQSLFSFGRPGRVLRRMARMHPRMRIDGNILLHRKQGDGLKGKIYDLGPGGASFYCNAGDFAKGETLLAEFEIPECGTFETLVTIARQEVLTNSRWRYLVGMHYNLTAEQRQKLEQILMRKKEGRTTPP